MLVSVIAPCYNQSDYLAQALESVLGQSYGDWECIIVNDGSTDNSEEIALAYQKRDPRIKYLVTEHKGPSAARNMALAQAKGKFIQFLDADDLIASNKFRDQVLFYEKHPMVDILYTGSRYFSDTLPGRKLVFNRNRFNPLVELTMFDSGEFIESVRIKNPFVISAPLHRIETFQKVGFFDEELGALEDWDFHLRCAEKNLIFHYMGYTPDTATFIRLHDASLSRNSQEMNNARHRFTVKHNTDFKTFGTDKDKIGAFLLLLTPPIIVIYLKRLRGLLKYGKG